MQTRQYPRQAGPHAPRAVKKPHRLGRGTSPNPAGIETRGLLGFASSPQSTRPRFSHGISNVRTVSARGNQEALIIVSATEAAVGGSGRGAPARHCHAGAWERAQRRWAGWLPRSSVGAGADAPHPGGGWPQVLSRQPPVSIVLPAPARLRVGPPSSAQPTRMPALPIWFATTANLHLRS
jgi:hypothetical protein